MSAYEASIKGHETVAEGTMAFHLEKPVDFNFKAGQAIDVILPTLTSVDAGNRHTFSIVSAPFEDDLTVATRMRDSPFKRALGAMPPGAPIRIEGPFGSLTLHNNRARPAVFIAGGIGITPFVSILRQAAKERLPQRFMLIYSNRRPEDAAFLSELQALEQQMESFALIATMSRAGESSQPWFGARGAIDVEVLKRAAANLSSPIYYLAGAPGMVESMRLLLNEAGVDDDDIRSEDFYGYS